MTSRMITKGVSSTSLLLLCVLSQACSTTQNPVDPSPESPGALEESPGALEVSISVTGTRPDSDGYAVAVSVGEGDPPSRTVGSIGGTVRFPDLPPGPHSVRLESLAPNCSVAGTNPRQITIAAGGTSQVGFAVFCPGPGAVLVKTITTGGDLDNDGYTIAFAASSTREVQVGANDSLLISEEDLPPAASWFVRLDGIAANCWIASPYRSTLQLAGDATTRIEFSVECMSWIDFNSGTIYERVTPQSSEALSYHGTQSERYILHHADSIFRLQYVSGRYGTFEYPGSYVRSGPTILFVFDNPGWVATGTLTGDSLFVQYNFDANMSGFEDAVFVRSQGAP